MAVALADRIYILRMLSETSQSVAVGLFHAWVRNTPVLLGACGEAEREEQRGEPGSRAGLFAGAAVGRAHAPDKLMFK